MQADRVFDALASGARRQLLRALAQGERTTSELAAHLSVSAPAASRHLSLSSTRASSPAAARASACSTVWCATR